MDREYVIETHIIGAYVGAPVRVYHLVNDRRIHEYTSKSLENIYKFCRHHDPLISDKNLMLLLSGSDKEKWNQIKDIYEEYYSRIRRNKHEKKRISAGGNSHHELR